jgi:hypothetical protein
VQIAIAVVVLIAMTTCRLGYGAEGSELPLRDCDDPAQSRPVPKTRLTQTEARALALEAARVRGMDLAPFHPPTICFAGSTQQWLVLFNGREAYPGNHFSVFVNDKTRSTMLVPGQ